MNIRPSRGLAAVLLSAATIIPLAANAESAVRTYAIATRIVEQAPSVGEFAGSLSLRVSADGIVSGYYRPEGNGRFISVTGGVSGTRLWLEIGAFAARPTRFSGTFSQGKIEAYSNTPFLDDGRFTGLELIGTPQGKTATTR